MRSSKYPNMLHHSHQNKCSDMSIYKLSNSHLCSYQNNHQSSRPYKKNYSLLYSHLRSLQYKLYYSLLCNRPYIRLYM